MGDRCINSTADEVHLFRDDGSAGPVFPFDGSRSAIATIPERQDNTLLDGFAWRLNRVFVFSPDPLRMVSHSDEEKPHPDRWLHQLASWIRHLQLESPEASRQFTESLRQDVLDGFVGYKFSHHGEGAYTLKFEFGSPDLDSDHESKQLLTRARSAFHRPAAPWSPCTRCSTGPSEPI